MLLRPSNLHGVSRSHPYATTRALYDQLGPMRLTRRQSKGREELTAALSSLLIAVGVMVLYLVTSTAPTEGALAVVLLAAIGWTSRLGGLRTALWLSVSLIAVSSVSQNLFVSTPTENQTSGIDTIGTTPGGVVFLLPVLWAATAAAVGVRQVIRTLKSART